MPTNEIKNNVKVASKSANKKPTEKKTISKKLIDANKVEVSADKKPKTSIAKKLINKNKVKVNPSTTAEKQKLSKKQLLKQAEEAVVRKYLTKTQKVTIATLTGVAVATSVVVPLVCNVVKNNNTTIVEPNPFNIAIYTNYTDSESGQEVFNIKPGTKVSELKPIVKEGYIFKGYFMDEECKIAYDPNHILKENDKIYALLEAEPIVEFTTNVYFMEEEITSLDIDTSMTIEEVEQAFWEHVKSGDEPWQEVRDYFIQEIKENAGLNYIGLCRDELGTQYPAGYKMKTTDTEIHLGFTQDTYRVSVPTGEGYVITDTAGNPITTFGTIPHGETIQFKIRLKEGYFGANEVKVGNTILTATNEIYSFDVTSEAEISVSETYLIAGQYTLNLGSNMEVMYFAEGWNLEESLALYGYTEENTVGFYSDAEFNNYIDISNTIATEDTTIYTTYGWKISDGVLTNVDGSAKSGTTEFIVPSGVTNIGSNAFSYWSNLTKITIPDSVTSIGDGAFNGCSKLQYNISSGLKYLGNDNNPYVVLADRETGDITTATIEDGCKFISASVFYACSSLENVTIPEGLIGIGNWAFNSCSSLTSIIIPSSVTSIGYDAFRNCSSLINVVFAEGSKLISIGDSAFNGCSNLTSISIPDSVTSIGEYTFTDCSKLQYNNSNGLKYLGNDANPYIMLISVETKDITTATIEDGCKFICSSAFNSCSSLTSITIPDSVTSLGSFAFSRCSSLKSITIPTSVTSMGKYTFFNCSSLTNVIFEEGSKLTSINDRTFEDCSSLKSITIPAGVTSMGKYTFLNCSSLTNVIFEEGSKLTSIGEDAFFNCGNLISITIPASVIIIESSAFYNCSGLESVIFEEGSQLTSIGVLAFTQCSKLTSIVIPDSVVSIGANAFHDCSGLESVTFENPNGWNAEYSVGSEFGVVEYDFISKINLTDTAQNAVYLTKTYVSYYWFKR